MLNQWTSLKNLADAKKKKFHYFLFMIQMVQNSLLVLDYNLALLINMDLDMVLVI